MSRIRWHRVFHPLCGADPLTLARLVTRAGSPSPAGALPLAVALACGIVRLPFTLGEAAWTAAERRVPSAPVFIIGYPRSGTTHLHNLMAASGQFATVPPVLAGLPWEARGLGRWLRPFIDPYLPETRLIDGVRLRADSPTEDELALANMCGLSYFHAIYFPAHLRRDYARALTFEGASQNLVDGRARALRRYVMAMGRHDGRALLLKNPAYTAQLGWLRRLFPEARFVHIHRDPRAVFASNRRALGIVLSELALQRVPEGEIDATVLETYPRVMQHLLRDARELPPDRFAEIGFEQLLADPLATFRRVWGQLELPAPDDALAAIGRYLATAEDYRAQGAAAAAVHSTLAERWRPYLALYGAPPDRPAEASLDAHGPGGEAMARNG